LIVSFDEEPEYWIRHFRRKGFGGVWRKKGFGLADLTGGFDVRG